MIYSLGGSLDARDNTFDFVNQYQIPHEADDGFDREFIRSHESYKSYRSRKLLKKQQDEYPPALYCGLYRRSSVHLIFFLLFIAFYISIGAICFKSIEEPTVREKFRNMSQKRKEFLLNHTCVSEESLIEFIRVIVETSGEGISPTVKYSEEDSVWGFGQAALFATTVVTTVGYGNTKPLSLLGKLFCIIYAIFGIPLVMMLFTALVDRLAIPSRYLFDWLKSKFEKTFGGLHVKLLHCFIMFMALVLFIFFIPTFIFINIEPDWDFIEALYYCYISLTTIGLGDYVPGEHTHGLLRQFYKLCITGYLFVGITCVLLFLRTFNEIAEMNIGYQFLSPYSDNRTSSTQTAETTGGPNLSETARDCHNVAADVGNVNQSIENRPSLVEGKQGSISSDRTRLMTSVPPNNTYNSVI